MNPVPHWFLHYTGSDNTSGVWYGFWSGFGSIILPPLLNALAVAAVFWWHHQCHVGGCFWYARRTTAAGERACWMHHPDRKRTADDIHAAHHAARGGADVRED
jgi:hypothetical protein